MYDTEVICATLHRNRTEGRVPAVNNDRQRAWGEDILVKEDLVGDCLGYRAELQTVQEL